MARVVSVFLPTLPTDRIRRADPSLFVETPLVIVARSGAKRWIAAVDRAATKLGLRVAMPAAKAQAPVQGLKMVDADPAADVAALERLTLWPLSQYSPVVAMDPPDGMIMDTEGADHLQGGEELMLSGLVNRLRGRGLVARTAHALVASHDQDRIEIVLELADRRRKCRLRNVADLGGPREMFLLGKRHEVGEVADQHAARTFGVGSKSRQSAQLTGRLGVVKTDKHL